MNHFTTFSELVALMRDLEYGRIEHLDIHVSPSDPALLDALQSEYKSLRRLAEHLVGQVGVARFEVLKIQDGLPVHGESVFTLHGHQAVRSHKFS